ncbi:hypothetical protein DD594_26815, partial [Enterobacter cloacae complex sp. 4DZ1-17B1]
LKQITQSYKYYRSQKGVLVEGCIARLCILGMFPYRSLLESDVDCNLWLYKTNPKFRVFLIHIMHFKNCAMKIYKYILTKVAMKPILPMRPKWDVWPLAILSCVVSYIAFIENKMILKLHYK